MGIAVKICGLSEPATLCRAVDGGAAMVGLNFYPPSPRAVRPQEAARLVRLVPETIEKVGIFVEPTNDELAEVLAAAPLDLLQCHGSETPARIAEIRSTFGIPVMKAIKVRARADLDFAHEFEAVADRLLFDAKAPKTLADALPGGNGLIFDWNLLKGRSWRLPWVLSGGLDAANLAEAVQICGARAVDVSSGVESAPGCKDGEAIDAFLGLARRLGRADGGPRQSGEEARRVTQDQ